ncbi:MAG: SprT-like domain-containing protein [Bdellovibrionia bacterium]
MLPVCGSYPDLVQIFNEINDAHFDGFLDPPQLLWNARLSSTAGRFIPGKRKMLESFPAQIEVASFLLNYPDALERVQDAVAHEMIHYWLWVRHQPYGHTPDFLAKMKLMGVSRYHSLKSRLRYQYSCPHCKKKFESKTRLGPLACELCCKQFSEGRYDPRFGLVLVSPGDKES